MSEEWKVKIHSRNCPHRYRAKKNENWYIACGNFIGIRPECKEINCKIKII